MYNQEDAPTDDLKEAENYQKYSSDDVNRQSTIHRMDELGIIVGGAKTKLSVELGDIIEICAPGNHDMDGKQFFVEYTGSAHIKLIDLESFTLINLDIDIQGNLKDKSIKVWTVLSREPDRGYAQLYGFLPKKWVNIFFTGELPQVITGQITNLEEDMIEVTPFETNADPIYIDFAYHGIPEDLAIAKIELREQPNIRGLDQSLAEENVPKFQGNQQASIEFLESGEAVFEIPDNVQMNERHDEAIIKEVIMFNDEEEFTVQVNIPEHEKVYGIQVQLAELLNAMLNKIPKGRRTTTVNQEIHKHLENFEYLRSYLFQFDPTTNQITDKVSFSASKLTEYLDGKINSRKDVLTWILPVAKVTKKIYHTTPVITEGEEDIELIDQLPSLKNQISSYENTISGENVLLYDLFKKRLQEAWQPTISPAFGQASTLISRNLEVILENTSPYQSSVSRFTKIMKQIEHSLTQRQFVLQPLKSGDIVTDIHQLITFPKPVIEYSRVNLPTTSIMAQSELSSSYLSIRSLVKTFMQKPNNKDAFSDTNFLDLAMVSDIHKLTYNIVDLFKTFAVELGNHSVSVIEMVRLLEPFLIYRENLRYADYLALVPILNHRIESQLSREPKTKRKEVEPRDKVPFIQTVMLHVPNKELNQEVTDTLSKSYGLQPSGKTISEALLSINAIDNGALFQDLIRYLVYYLVSPDKDLTEEELVLPDTTAAKYTNNDYSKYQLAKKYLSWTALNNDNRRDIYFDKDLDKTSYDLYTKSYQPQKKKYSDSDFREFVTQNLLAKHIEDDPVKAELLAKTLISGKKMVQDHDIALLEEIPKLKPDITEVAIGEEEKAQIKAEAKLKTKLSFYERINGEWILREDMTSFVDGPLAVIRMFRNGERPSSVNKTIEPTEVKELAIRSIGEKTAKLTDDIKNLKTQAMRKKLILTMQHNRLSIQKFDMGTLVKDLGKNKKSPYEGLRQMILMEPDFVLKQSYIVKLFTRFCRLAERSGEDTHWGYCKDTGVKLFPLSLYQLAVAFSEGRFQQRLDEMILQIGEKSGDGDAIIDKHTGYLLKRLDYSTDEGFDEAGFKISSHSIMEKDAVEIALKELGTSKVFSNLTAEKVHTIFHILRQQTGLKDDDSKEIETNTIQQSIRLLCNPSKLSTQGSSAQGSNDCSLNETMFLTEKEFNRQQQDNKKKSDGKTKPIAYATYVNRNVISSTIAMYLVAIQTSLNVPKPRRVFPNCKYSFGGYPLANDKNNIDGLTYLSCVVQRSAGRNNSIQKHAEMWSSIVGSKSYTIENLIQNVLDILAYCIESDILIRELYTRKAEFDQLRIIKEAIPKDLALSKWTKFLPPLISLKSAVNPTELDAGFERELDKMIAHGRKGQDLMISSLLFKTMFFSFGVMERVQRILDAKGSSVNLLHKSFVQNSCCNDTATIHPMTYFMAQDPMIKTMLLQLVKIERMHTKYAGLAKGRVIGLPKVRITPNKSKVVNVFSEKTIYQTFFTMCNFDRGLPCPPDLIDICIKKPAEYVPTDPLPTKIEVMKKNGVNLGLNQFNQLMDHVHRQNILNTPKVEETDVFNTCIEFLKTRFSTKDPIFSQHMVGLIQQCSQNPKKTSLISIEDIDHETNESLDLFIDYLSETNQAKIRTILDFLQAHVSKETTERAIQFIRRINKQPRILSSTLEQNISFVRNSVKNLAIIYPQMILNQTSSVIAFETLDRWGFSEKHNAYLESHTNQASASLGRFFDGNELVVNEFLGGMGLSIYSDLIAVLPLYREIQIGKLTCYNSLNQTAIDLILKYAWLSTVETIVSKSADPELGKKSQREQRLTKQSDDNLSLPIEDNPLLDVYDDILPELNFNDLNLFRTKVARMIEAFLQLEQDSFKALDYNYTTIKNESFKISEAEKKTLFTKIGKMNQVDKKLDKIMRALKLGAYYVAPNMMNNPDFFAGKENVGLNDDDLANIQEQNNQQKNMELREDEANDLYDVDGVEENKDGEVGFE